MNFRHRLIPLILRFLLGGLFIYAGVSKWIGVEEFGDAIAGFRLVPVRWIMPIALVLPVFEITLGVMVLLPMKTMIRAGALGILILNGLFIFALACAWARGLKVECGCFGTGFFPDSRWNLQIAILRDVIFAVMAFVIWKITISHAKTDGDTPSV